MSAAADLTPVWTPTNDNSFDHPARSYFSGMGQAVADRTINRKTVIELEEPMHVPFSIAADNALSIEAQLNALAKSDGYRYDGYEVERTESGIITGRMSVTSITRKEEWADVALRVAHGNSLLHPVDAERQGEFSQMHRHLRQASILMSGRHLQHGDETQPTRPIEVYTNCSTAAMCFLSFYLLLNGSGVGRAYDDAMMLVDWNDMPTVVPIIEHDHADVQTGEIRGYLTRREAEHLYGDATIHHYEVPDSREGWAKAVERIETMAFAKVYRDDVLLIDFTKVRARGQPIKGMQNRPASGPGTLMDAISKVARIRDARMDPWLQALYIDHYMAECVLVGGARRAARMATKTWRDKNVLRFIAIKRGGHLWSANNSVTVDEEFRELCRMSKVEAKLSGRLDLWKHANAVFDALAEASYYDRTGEPGIINQDRLTQNMEGFDGYLDGLYAQSTRFAPEPDTLPLMRALAQRVKEVGLTMITNPCGEISLLMLGGYCVIADVVPFHCLHDLETWGMDRREWAEQWDQDAEEAFRIATRALIRTNQMEALYHRETQRTNRIGVGMTGFHEYAWARFRLGWKAMLATGAGFITDANGLQLERPSDEALVMWKTIARFARAIAEEARLYSEKLGVVVPHTMRTFKPAGTTSKLFGLTEGAHLPSMREYVRWVQFRSDDPLVKIYEAKGYPVKHLTVYKQTTVTGFPTSPTICSLGMGDELVTAAEATPEEQTRFLRLLETFWIRGVDDDLQPIEERGNQVSYTLKYDPELVDFDQFKALLKDGIFNVRCCSVMPQIDATAYEYQPEQPVSKAEYELILEAIVDHNQREDIGREHVDCASGACPIDFNEGDKTKAA